MRNDRRRAKLALILPIIMLSLCSTLTGETPIGPTVAPDIDYAVFQNPPAEYRGHAWLDFRLGNISDDMVNKMVDQAAQSNSYGGFMITSTGAGPGSLS
ncbi:MAG: hypothetical protein H6Q07_1293, partial [Acidobacteria bacterium]|nr:hypothetical protein [Acidobacteriota bacterium]